MVEIVEMKQENLVTTNFFIYLNNSIFVTFKYELSQVFLVKMNKRRRVSMSVKFKNIFSSELFKESRTIH